MREVVREIVGEARPVWFLVALVGSLLAVSRPSQAAVFDFSGLLATAGSMGFTQDGVSVTVTGWAGSAAALVHQDEDGLGVTYEGDRASNTSASQVDGLDELEALVLTFAAPVSLLRVTFSLVGSNDQFSLLVDDALLFEGNIPSSRTKSFSADNVGQVFTFGTGEADDDYKVKGLEVELVAGAGSGAAGSGSETTGQGSAAVPEASSLALLGVGLAGFWRRWR